MVDRTLNQVLAELELCSHVNAVNLNGSARDAGEDIGGKRPPGGIDERNCKESVRPLRSADYFRRQLANGRRPALLLAEAEAALEAWRRQPPPAREEWPAKDTPFWRRWVAESEFSPEKIGAHYHLSRRYIAKIKADFLP